MEQRFSGQIMQRAADPAARQATLGEIGINQFAPYLMNRIMERWNGNLAEALEAPRHVDDHDEGAGRPQHFLAGDDQRAFRLCGDRAVDDEPHARHSGGARACAASTAAEDMRIRDVSITEEGRAAFERVWPMMHARFQTLFDGVEEEEYRAFTATLLKILRNVAKLPE